MISYNWRSLSLVLACAAGAIPQLSAQYHFDSWTTENGLPQNSIRAIRQTRDGYLWMTTLSSFVRFDGVRFREFNRFNTPGLSTDNFSVFTLTEDRQGCLWSGTNTFGVVRYCNGVFTTFTTRDGLPHDSVIRIDEDSEGTLWFYTNPGLAKWQDGRIVPVAPLPGSPFNDVLRAPTRYVGVDGFRYGLWRIGENEKEWHRFAFGKWTPFPLPPQLKGEQELHFNSVVEDSNRRLWYTFRGEPGTYYSLQNGRLTTFRGMPPEKYVSYQDARGNLWESAMNGRTNLWKDGVTTPLEVFSTSNVFRGFEDREGSVWLGTAWNGLFRATPAIITPALPKNDKSPDLDHVEAVMQDADGDIWYGSNGLHRIRNGKVRSSYYRRSRPGDKRAIATPLEQNLICALHKDPDGTIWAGSHNGVAILSGDYLESKGPTAEIRGSVFAIHRHRNGDLWIGGGRGLYRLRNGDLTHFTRAHGLPVDPVTLIREGPKGEIWIGTPAGLVQFMDGRFSPVAPGQGPDQQNITALYQDSAGVLWIGTYGDGIYRLEHGKAAHLTSAAGLSTNHIFQILEDDRGYLWLSSHTGVHRVKKNDLNEFAAGRLSTFSSTGFGKSDGMRSADCNRYGQPNGIQVAGGNLWFPTIDGLAVLDPRAAQVNPQPPPVRIEDTLIDDRPTPTGQPVTLDPGQLSLDIQYTALSFIKSSQIRFRYKMEGLDPNWIDAGPRRTAYYTRIPPGQYTFHVIAANSDGVWNTDGARLTVTVLPHVYQTWWFRLLAALALVGLTITAWRYRVTRLEHARALQQTFSRQLIASQEEERKRIAADLHDSIGQRLVIVKNLAAFYLRSQGPDTLASGILRPIEEISAEASLAINETRDVAYNLRPFQLDRLGLTKAIEGVVRTVSTASATTFTLNLDNIDDVFPEDLRINFFRIVQESLQNIVKHAQASNVDITVQRTTQEVQLTIRDDGKGFTPGAPGPDSDRGGFGVTGMAERALLLGGRFSVHAAPGQGTVVSVRIPLTPLPLKEQQ